MRQHPRRSDKNDEGVALLLALLFVALLTVLVVEYTYETQVDVALVDANLSDYQAMIAAKSAVASGISLLTADLMTPTGTQTGETGGTGQQAQGEEGGTAGGAAYDSLDEAWAYGVPFEEINNAVMQCTIDDEFGKINLNALLSSRTQEPNETLEQALRYLFEQRGAEEDPTDAILDWIDGDDEQRPNGAEADYYQSLTTPYPCKNAPMNSVEELLLVRGMTPELFFGIEGEEPAQLPLSELFTVHGHRNGRVNVNTAEVEVLTALGEALAMPGLADIVVEERLRLPFSSNQDLVQRGVLPPQEQGGQGGQSTRRSRPFTVASTSFRLQGNGMCGEARVRIEAFLVRDAEGGVDGIRIADWKEVR
ncbi:MAG TPA: type II secretion system minor pseudopilin GspK [Candidatus Hydrogenedentes bacterium]|nr:type II secretion system minor pseudopilin GspK [Candidatus Hydrogenedentota bacterium]